MASICLLLTTCSLLCSIYFAFSSRTNRFVLKTSHLPHAHCTIVASWQRTKFIVIRRLSNCVLEGCSCFIISICCHCTVFILFYIVGTHFSPRCVRVSGVSQGSWVAWLWHCWNASPMHHSVKRTVAAKADCHPAYRRWASLPLIDSGRGHSLTLSLHIKGLLRQWDSQWEYIT